MASRYESNIDRAIREAQERGEFDDLPGLGKPLPDRGEAYDENWWLKDLARRESLGAALPKTLLVRKEVEDLPAKLDTKSYEAAVRQIVTDLNQRISQVQRGLSDGPPIWIDTIDVEQAIQGWRDRRSNAGR